MRLDLPTLERPMKATSGSDGGGRVAMLTAPVRSGHYLIGL